MSDILQLRQLLSRIDGSGYKAYKRIRGTYDFPDFTLFVDHVQGDPFALPSKIRLRAAQSQARIPGDIWPNSIRKTALEDFIARAVRQSIQNRVSTNKGSGKSGLVFIDAGRQEVLERTAIVVSKNWVEARIQVGLPANGRRILGKEAIKILCDEIPKIVKDALYWDNFKQEDCLSFLDCVENQEAIRRRLDELNMVAFIANGAVLPRKSGINDQPMSGDSVVEFQSTDSLEISVKIPNSPSNGNTEILGMGIPRGVTLIVGGGYHGKSTLLKALERSVYAHIPNDGREYVVTNPTAVKIRAEDGRRVEKVNINPFISNLPQAISTVSFCSDDASGSTSQAANIMEALEAGAKLLLLDEDTSATNFMVRDARMQQLVHKEEEPITPFVDRVRELYENCGVSTILVMGGSGDYFDVADTIIKMQDYCPHNVGDIASKIVDEHPTKRQMESPQPLCPPTDRIPQYDSFDSSRGRRQVKIETKSHDLLVYGTNMVDLRYVDQLVEKSQTRAIGHAIFHATQHVMGDIVSLKDVVNELEELFDQKGLDFLDPYYREGEHPGNYSRPRKHEIAAAINRLRPTRVKQKK